MKCKEYNTIDQEIFISEDESVKQALKKLNKSAMKVLIVIENNRQLLGTITDGDIRRHILNGESLELSIKKVYNKRSRHVSNENFSMKAVKKILLEHDIDLLPITNKNNEVVDFITWSQAFSEDKAQRFRSQVLDVPVVIMAGGKGTRLDPFSRIFPKPLIPVGEKPIIELIIEEFERQGINTFHLVLNYKGEMIKSYFDYRDRGKVSGINFIWEEEFLGTAGSLTKFKNVPTDSIIVSNCDVIAKADYRDVMAYHKKSGALLTVLSSIQHHKIPYGVIEITSRGDVSKIIEKPEYTFMVNTGVYILEKEVLEFIPEKESFDMTDLISSLLKQNQKVMTYPINEDDYIDVGQWTEYKAALEKFTDHRE